MATVISTAAVTFGGPSAAQAPRPEPAPVVQTQFSENYPAPQPERDPGQLGMGVQRTMRLLATSTPKHRNHVRILFYGQSITEQDWTKRVTAGLKHRFPYADLEVENRAIGGFASQLLVRPAEHDLYPFYPDLLIFHVYGADNTYEEIIRSVRERTASEVLMQKDHATSWPAEHVDRTQNRGKWWDDYMNSIFLPETAKKYGCGLVDIRSGWVDYLKANHLEPPQLTIDGTHLNDQGNFLMARLIERYLAYRPEIADSEPQDLARTYRIGTEARWKSGRLELPFTGNRIDLLPSLKASAEPVTVLIDGRPPSTFEGCYAITRPQPNPWVGPLALSRVDHNSPLAIEDWKLVITSVSADSKSWSFDVTGSVTGPDGSGDSSQPFVSRSGRVVIHPADFFRGFAREAVPVGHTITWRVVPMFHDVYTPAAGLDPSGENPVTLAQGFPNGQHTLTLIATGASNRQSPARAIRVYRPPLLPARQPD
jgi:hypothetical protein